MTATLERLRSAICAIEAHRAAIGDATAELALVPLRDQLARLQGEPAPRQQLRQVSVLFVDIVSSTQLANGLDPEDLHAVMDGALKAFTRCVQRHGGRVLQYAGDSLLAAFGSERVHEDDAVFAVRAALAVLDEARARSASGLAGVRAGIATGDVLLGGGVDADSTIRGITVHLAARLEQHTPPGRLRICATTQRLVRGHADLAPQPPLALKGYAQPVPSWLVDGLRPAGERHALRGVGGVPAPLIGRDDELAALREAHAQWLATGGRPPRLLLVSGDAGIGKSRVVAEFRRGIDARWLVAQAAEREADRPWSLVRQLFARHCGLAEGDATAHQLAQWQAAMAPLLPSADDAQVLARLLGLDSAAGDAQLPAGDARALRDRGRFHALQALRRLADDGPLPLALMLEDLHWADGESLAFLNQLLTEGADLRLLIAATTRPTLDERRPGWADGPGRLGVVLEPLGPSQSQQLAGALLARLQDGSAAPLAERLTRLAEGNPFHMEEWVNLLLDRGAIEVQGEQWTLAGPLPDESTVPATLAGVVQARLDMLPEDEAHALALASVVGPVFWDDALAAAGFDGTPPLTALVRRRLIVERPTSRLHGTREFAFRHHLLHQVCYERVIRRVRVPAHARVAQWLAARPGEVPLELVAEHFELGHETAAACQAWHRAAEACRSRYANAEVLAHIARARRLCGPGDLQRQLALALLGAGVAIHLGEPSIQQDELHIAEALADALQDERSRCKVLDLKSRVLHARGEFHAALPTAEQALTMAERVAPDLTPAIGRTVLNLLQCLGRGTEVSARASWLLERARQFADQGVEGAVMNLLGMVEHDRGALDLAMTHYCAALACHRATGHRSHEAGVLSNLGYTAMALGKLTEARESFASAAAVFASIGERENLGLVHVNLAMAALHAEAPDRALTHLDTALPLLRAAGCNWGEASAIRVSGQAWLMKGEAAFAMKALHSSLDTFNRLALGPLALEARASLASAAWHAGKLAEALEHAGVVCEALLAPSPLDGAEEPLRVFAETWQVLNAMNDPRAPAVLLAGRSWLNTWLGRLSDPAHRAHAAQYAPHAAALTQASVHIDDLGIEQTGQIGLSPSRVGEH